MDTLIPTKETVALYESMSTTELWRMRAAFSADEAYADRPETIAFSVGRIDLIDDVLRKRGYTSWAPPQRFSA